MIVSLRPIRFARNWLNDGDHRVHISIGSDGDAVKFIIKDHDHNKLIVNFEAGYPNEDNDKDLWIDAQELLSYQS